MPSTGALTKLAHTQISDSQGTLIAAPSAGTAKYPRKVVIFNNHTIDQLVKLYINDGTNTYQFWEETMVTKSTSYPDIPDLPAGCSVEGVTTTAAKVTFTATGILETIT